MADTIDLTDFPTLSVLDHPLIQVRLTTLRNKTTATPEFRRALHDIAELAAFELTRDLELAVTEVETPLVTTKGAKLARRLVLVPILRAGVGMLNGFSDLLSESVIGHIGMYRDEETLEPKSYYTNLPTAEELAESDVILIDPMLATGSSSAEAASQLKSAGARRIRFVSLIAAPEGVRHFAKQHPDVRIFTASLDECLNENAYIVPGLGDAGDRYFGT